MIKFTDRKKEYIWTDDDEIIGMDKISADMLKMADKIAIMTNNHILKTSLLESEGFSIIEQDEEPEEAIY